jgi:hypothetical protein
VHIHAQAVKQIIEMLREHVACGIPWARRMLRLVCHGR